MKSERKNKTVPAFDQEALNTVARETRKKLEISPNDWPGNPGTRSVVAAIDYTPKHIAKIFIESPSSKWVITCYEIIERNQFFKDNPDFLRKK